MSVNIYDVVIYGSAEMSDTTGVTGGAVDFSTKVTFTDVTSEVVPSVVSSNASDTATTLTVTSLASDGVAQSEILTLTGTTPVVGSLSASRLMKTVQGGTTPIGGVAVLANLVIDGHTAQAGSSDTITLASGDGADVALDQLIRITNNTPSGVAFQLRSIVAINGDVVTVSRPWTTAPTSATEYDVYTGMLFDLAPNQISQVRRIFYGAVAQAVGGSTNTMYEKVFAVNNNTSTTLTSGVVIKNIDPIGLYSGGGELNFALTTALNDTGDITTNLNPVSPPSGVTGYSSGEAPQSISVPSPGNLPAGAVPNADGAQGIWYQLVLVAGEATINSFVGNRITGVTT